MKIKMILTPLLIVLAGMVNASDMYTVKVKGQQAGRALLSIKQDLRQYQVDLSLYPVALAKIFGIDDMVESAQGMIDQGHYFPQRYHRQDDKGRDLLSVDFHQNSVLVTDKEGEKSLDIPAGGQDPLTQIAQIQYDISQGKLSDYYDLVTDRSVQRYSAVQQQDYVVLVEQPSKRRELYLWFDNAFNLTAMQKRKDGKIQLEMQRIDN